MGKNHRHKKKLKAEKAKVHITSKTKFLPKGQNVTDTSFKIKPIVVQEQLRDKDSGGLWAKPRHSVTELVSKLKHYNDTMKTEACEGLQDMVKNRSEEVLPAHLAAVIQNASPLIQDRERKVRKASVKLINEILQHTPTSNLEPFFNHISTNLRCAMTNIDQNLQEDSLLLLDSLLNHAPSLVAQDSDRIFPDFLTLISKMRHNSTSERTLTLNLGGKVTSVRWRIKVLSRLYSVLDAMIKERRRKEASNGRRDSGPIVHIADRSCFLPLYKKSEVYEFCPFDIFGNNVANVFDSTKLLTAHVGALVPLLYETWLEVVPEKVLTKNSNETTMLNEEAVAILSCTVNILYLLHEYLRSSKVLQDQVALGKETDKFLDHLLAHFPFGQNRQTRSEAHSKDVSKVISKVFASKNDPRCVEENLLVCRLFCATTKTDVFSKTDRRKVAAVAAYLNRCLLVPDLVSTANGKHLVAVLKEVLLERPKFWEKGGVDVLEVVENSVNFYERSRMAEEGKAEVLKMLTSSDSFFRSEKYQEWLVRLPNSLCAKEVSGEVVDVILDLSRKNCGPVHDSLAGLVGNVVENLAKMRVKSGNEDEVKMKIVHAFFYLPAACSLVEIENFVTTNPDSEYSTHLRNMLQLRNQLRKVG